MQVRPLLNYHLLGTDIRLDNAKVYEATPATNQPDWEKRGAIFVDEILLETGDYEIVKN